jgi:ATP-dependent DNA helicase RecQ
MMDAQTQNPSTNSAILATLRTAFGFETFRPGQAQAIQSLLSGQHTMVVMPTGAGKSLIYQLAALHLPGVTLVLSPLIALMKDQVDSLTRHRVPATFINSALTPSEQTSRLEALAQGAFRLAYVAPERLRSVPFQKALRHVSVGLLAVDEAHCVSQWGHDFRPDYLHIAAARERMGNPLTAALTATATPQVQEEITRLLGIPSATRIVTGFNRPNLSFEVAYTSSPAAKLAALREMLDTLDNGAALVYVGTRRDAVGVADFIRGVIGRKAEHYHGKMAADERTRIQDAFMQGRLPIVVATNAFGMGIDRADVRLVAHFAMPGTLEAYYQEAGRAGRDGKPAQAVLLYDPEDRALQEFFIENEAPSLDDLRELYDALKNPVQADQWKTAEGLSLTTGQPEVKVKVGLAQLETAGAVEHLGDEGVRMLLRLGEWNDLAVRATTAQSEARRRHRRQQLEQMIRYGETNQCRRRILLQHFGDKGPADAPRCCDNCLARSEPRQPKPHGDPDALAEADRLGLIILDAVRRLEWGVGREKLAQMLKGSRARDMQQFGYHKHVYYGRLPDFSQAEIGRLIDQLVGQRYLKVISGEWPVLGLTPRGESAITDRAPIPLRLPQAQMAKVVRKKSQREAGGTVRLTEQMFIQGIAPAQIAQQRGLSERTIYNHLAELIGKGALELGAVVPAPVIAQVHAAIQQAGGGAALSPIKFLLPDEVSYEQIRCVVEDWKRGHADGSEVNAEDEIAGFLARSHPVELKGPWHAGWSLGFHSGFAGADWGRSPTGEQVYRLKYQGDRAALQPLVEQAAALCHEHPELAEVDAIVPVPPSTPREFDPVGAVVEALGKQLGLPVWSILHKTRQTRPQKELQSLAQKRANVRGAFAIKGQARGKRLLIMDDLYDSGATLEEAARMLKQAGATRLCVLALTSTIHADA